MRGRVRALSSSSCSQEEQELLRSANQSSGIPRVLGLICTFISEERGTFNLPMGSLIGTGVQTRNNCTALATIATGGEEEEQSRTGSLAGRRALQ